MQMYSYQVINPRKDSKQLLGRRGIAAALLLSMEYVLDRVFRGGGGGGGLV